MNSDAVLNRLLTRRETSDLLRVSVGTIDYEIRTGRLPVVRLSRRAVRIRPQDLRRYIDNSVAAQPRSHSNVQLER